MTRMAQFPIDNDVWFDFRIECRRRSLRIADVVPALIQAQLATWTQEREAQEDAATDAEDILSEEDHQRHLYGSDE